jgi:hypothetical protein
MSTVRYILQRYRIQLLGATAAIVSVMLLLGLRSGTTTPAVQSSTTLPPSVSIDVPSTLAPPLSTSVEGEVSHGVPVFKLSEGVVIPSVQAGVWKAKTPTAASVAVLGERLGLNGAVSGDAASGFHLSGLMVLGNGTWSYSSSAACTGTSCKTPPKAAANFMNEADATRRAEELFGEDVEIARVTRDQFQTLVFGAYIIDGLLSDQVAQAGFGPNGELLQASGIVGEVEKLGEYQTLSQAALMEKLASGTDVRGASPCVQDPACEINDVKPGLVLVLDKTGAEWFVPGYVLRDTRGGRWVLQAVDIAS